jgi:hypothetical protein
VPTADYPRPDMKPLPALPRSPGKLVRATPASSPWLCSMDCASVPVAASNCDRPLRGSTIPLRIKRTPEAADMWWVLSRVPPEAATEWLLGRRLWCPGQEDELACVLLRDGRGQVDIRGLVTAGRGCSPGALLLVQKSRRGIGGVDPLPLIAATQVAPRAATSSFSWSGCFGVWAAQNSSVGQRRWGQGGLFIDRGDSCRCVGRVSVARAQRSEHERR